MKKRIKKKKFKLRLPPEYYLVSIRNRVIKNKKKQNQIRKCRKKIFDFDDED
jgi:hypothetical protein